MDVIVTLSEREREGMYRDDLSVKYEISMDLAVITQHAHLSDQIGEKHLHRSHLEKEKIVRNI